MKENPSAPKLLDFCNPIVKGDGKMKNPSNCMMMRFDNFFLLIDF